MFLSPTKPAPAVLRQVSIPSEPSPTEAVKPFPEDSCVVPQPPLSVSDPALWCVAAILVATTGWLIG